MKIGLRAPRNEFTDEFFKRLGAVMDGDEVVFWDAGGAAPAKDLEVLVSMAPLTGEAMDGLPGLALIQVASDGYDAVDVDAATERGIWVSASPGDETGNALSVAEYAVMMVLAVSRRLGTALASIDEKGVARPMLNQALMGRTVCLVGWGSIGSMVAERLKPFGVRLTAVDRSPEKVPEGVPVKGVEEIQEGVRDADYVVVCVRGTKENRHMIDAGVMAAMKKGAYLVNVARGSLVDEAALLAAVTSGHLAGAGLDVTEKEPVTPENPLYGVAGVFLTPHIAGFTELTVVGTARYVGEVLRGYKAGKKGESMLNEPKSPRKALAG